MKTKKYFAEVNMKKLGRLLLGSMLMLAVTPSWAIKDHGGNNGTNLDEVMQADAMTAEHISYLLFKGSAQFKKEVLEPIVKHIVPEAIADQEVSRMWSKMQNTSNAYTLLDDVRYAQYDLGTCTDENMQNSGASACTGNFPGSSIRFDINAMLAAKVSFAELVGIIIHEHSHHFLAKGEDDHVDYDGDGVSDYRLQLFMRDAYIKGLHLGKDFTLNSGLESRGRKLIANFANEKEIDQHRKDRADNFCRDRNFARSLPESYEVKDFDSGNKQRFSEIHDDLRSYFIEGKSGFYFTKITCVH